MAETQHAQLIAWLQDRGHSREEIEKILAKVEQYDEQTQHDSVFDSIASGSLDLDAIVREALDGD